MQDRIEEAFARTLDDRRLSRGERHALTELLAEAAPGRGQVAALRARAFDAARGGLASSQDASLLDWLEDVVKILAAEDGKSAVKSLAGKAYFSPGTACVERIRTLFKRARSSVDVCVFTITDNRISDEVLRAHGRGVAVRILTDDLKSEDEGSDVTRLAAAGIPVAYDSYDKHMHHKFAIFDRKTLLTGSYNWTRSASEANEENVVVTRDPGLLKAFQREFEKLWRRYSS